MFQVYVHFTTFDHSDQKQKQQFWPSNTNHGMLEYNCVWNIIYTVVNAFEMFDSTKKIREFLVVADFPLNHSNQMKRTKYSNNNDDDNECRREIINKKNCAAKQCHIHSLINENRRNDDNCWRKCFIDQTIKPDHILPMLCIVYTTYNIHTS